jgi:TusA-related sulfurtransferase
VIASIAIDAGDLPLGGGLLALVRPALLALEPGGVLAINSTAPSVVHDLPSWCRIERHRYIGYEDGRHLIERGSLGVPRGEREWGHRLKKPTAAEVLRAVPMPDTANADTGFAPRGARVEPGGPRYPFDLVTRDRVAPPEVAQLYDQAVAAQWEVARDIPWDSVGEHDPAIEAAVCQVMTFLAENELSALYVPSQFMPRIHPAYVETAMFLATQMADEARHIDVFLKRARVAGGGLGVSSVTTSRSLLSLLEYDDFTEAAFVLSVLGEGTFLDLLRFVEEHAPDACTAEIARRTRNDESRHVHFGLAHVRHALGTDPTLFGRLESAVRRRAATLHDVGGVPAPLQDALTLLAAGSTTPSAVARGHEAYRALLDAMHVARIKRLDRAGFTPEQAELMSTLHTANFM